MPAYFLDPFGCVKNQVDAENMMARLDGEGWVCSQDAAEADLLIVNSCGFIEDAKRESIDAVMEWRRLFPEKKILLAGCLAQRYGDTLPKSMPEADGFFGTDDIAGIAAAAASLVPEGLTAPAGVAPSFRTADRPLLSLPGSAYVKIGEGCDNGCSFCAIPLIRGPLRCRGIADIVEECRGLLARGVRELCVIGQDVGSYRSAEGGLPELLTAIAGIEGDFWVRLLYIHPDNFPMPILDLMERDRRFLPYFDIPFQHAARGVLSAMNRRGDAETYLSLAEAIRGRLPDAVIRTTFLVGFPGETEKDFDALRDFQETLRADWLGCFVYSREEGTAAFAMPDRVRRGTANARKRKVEDSQSPISERNMERFVGRRLDVLLEEESGVVNGEGEPLWLGRLFCHAPEVDGVAIVPVPAGGAQKAGDMLPCEVVGQEAFDLVVRLTG